jgi:inosine/xanthosine triphosphate pyrophosphatase family protein
MLPMLTKNSKKYEPFQNELKELGIKLEVPHFEIPELQQVNFMEVLSRKAQLANELYGSPCLIDESGLLLEAYPGFPGPMTKFACKTLSTNGLKKLLEGVTNRAHMECYIGCWSNGRLLHWKGATQGILDSSRTVVDKRNILTSLFVPDEINDNSDFLYRRRALEKLAQSLEKLRNEIKNSSIENQTNCVFCVEFSGSPDSIYHNLFGNQLSDRIVHKTDNFFVLPPLGEFIPGGLLITSKNHFLSCAYLPDESYDELERLMAETTFLLRQHYKCNPVFFEHGPKTPSEKGVCCVDHAHLNVFPAEINLHRHLALKYREIVHMSELTEFRNRKQSYLFVQENDGRRRVYDVDSIPSQLIRKIITRELDMPERWHWREYLGLEELKKTYDDLSGWRLKCIEK